MLARQSYERSLDNFKVTLGLPADAKVELDRDELTRLVEASRGSMIQKDSTETTAVDPNETVPSADAPIELAEPSMEGAGRYEIDAEKAVKLALANRLDLKEMQGGIYDAQRAVVVAADMLGAELNLGGACHPAERPGPTDDDTKLRFDKVTTSGLLSLDLPIERTRERNDYRNSLIALEAATRDAAALEDSIKVTVRDRLRSLLSARESLHIQGKALEVAQQRVESANISLEAGRRRFAIFSKPKIRWSRRRMI